MNVGSGAGRAVMPAAVAYVASKHFIAGFSAALLADLAGTGVVVTEVAPGPVTTEFEIASGIEGDAPGLPPRWLFGISAEQCAREAVAGFRRGRAVVYPGSLYRRLMRWLHFVPGPIQRLITGRVGRQLREAGAAAARGATARPTSTPSA
jgi:short-subunit dehydrogenase